MRYWIIAAATFLFLAQPALAAPPIDCAGPIAEAQKALGKAAGDLAGMNKMMGKAETKDVHRLLARAQRLLGRAQKGCDPSQSPYDQAQAIGQAGAAHGYATAADVLHFHYMQHPGSAKEESGKKEPGDDSDMNDMPKK